MVVRDVVGEPSRLHLPLIQPRDFVFQGPDALLHLEQVATGDEFALLRRVELAVGRLDRLQQRLLFVTQGGDSHSLQEPRLERSVQLRHLLPLGGLVQPEQTGQPPVAYLRRAASRHTGREEATDELIRLLRIGEPLEARTRPLLQHAGGIVQKGLLQAVTLPGRLELEGDARGEGRLPGAELLNLPVLRRVAIE